MLAQYQMAITSFYFAFFFLPLLVLILSTYMSHSFSFTSYILVISVKFFKVLFCFSRICIFFVLILTFVFYPQEEHKNFVPICFCLLSMKLGLLPSIVLMLYPKILGLCHANFLHFVGSLRMQSKGRRGGGC